MSDLISRQDMIATVYNQSDDDGLWAITAKEMEQIINEIPSAEPEQTHNIMDFVGYQVAWLESHNDIELEPELEKWIVRMLHDTAECYIKEHPEPERKTGKWVLSDLIKRDEAICGIHYLLDYDGFKGNSGFVSKKSVIAMLGELPSAEPEPLTDKEQRIFLAAMGREEKVCKEVDDECRTCREPYEDSLVRTCHEIIRKVRGALWT